MIDKSMMDRFSGFADMYDSSRPGAPKELPRFILRIIRKKKAEKIVDLGCGTGLSTFVWRKYGKQIIGIEPNHDMRRMAEKNRDKKHYANVFFKNADSFNTELESDSADIVTCSQAFHWMEPVSTLKEVNRILVNGGAFVVYDYRWPPIFDPASENAFNDFKKIIKNIEAKNKFSGDVKRWDKAHHFENINKSGYFRYTKEFYLNNKEYGNAERFTKLALSGGGFQTTLKNKVSLEELGFPDFVKKVKNSIGNKKLPMYFSYIIRVGVK